VFPFLLDTGFFVSLAGDSAGFPASEVSM
jgi:hypothetical protein